MDDQKPQEQNTSDNSVEDSTAVPINEITPPPVEESTGQKINVKVGTDSNDEQDKSDENSDLVVEEPAEEPKSEEASPEEQLAPVAAPPDEMSDNVSDKTEPVANPANIVEEPSSENGAPKTENPQASQEPAIMGVAASQMNKHPHRNNKKLATVVTIITALTLAGVAVFVYISANKNTDSDNSETSQTNGSSYESQQEVTAKPATAEDIDQTIVEVEESLSALDDSADFNEDSLSNDTLGL